MYLRALLVLYLQIFSYLFNIIQVCFHFWQFCRVALPAKGAISSSSTTVRESMPRTWRAQLFWPTSVTLAACKCVSVCAYACENRNQNMLQLGHFQRLFCNSGLKSNLCKLFKTPTGWLGLRLLLYLYLCVCVSVPVCVCVSVSLLYQLLFL